MAIKLGLFSNDSATIASKVGSLKSFSQLAFTAPLVLVEFDHVFGKSETGDPIRSGAEAQPTKNSRKNSSLGKKNRSISFNKKL